LIEKQDVRCCFNHDPSNLLGRTKNNTLMLAEDNVGLHYDCDLNPDTRIAADVHAMVDRGDLDGCSFSFIVRKCTWREEADSEGLTVNYRDIEDVDLFELGPVTFPAYEGTSVGARSLSLWPDGVPAEIRSHVPALKDGAGRRPTIRRKNDRKNSAAIITLDQARARTAILQAEISLAER
jgi:HK97 family phage prohead protease